MNLRQPITIHAISADASTCTSLLSGFFTAYRARGEFAEERGIHEGDIVPRMDEWEVFPREAVACALQSIKEGVARVKLSRQELWDRAVSIIKNVRESTSLLMKEGLIPPPPEEV